MLTAFPVLCLSEGFGIGLGCFANTCLSIISYCMWKRASTGIRSIWRTLASAGQAWAVQTPAEWVGVKVIDHQCTLCWSAFAWRHWSDLNWLLHYQWGNWGSEMVKIFPFNIPLLEKKLFPNYSASVLLRVLAGELLKGKKFAEVLGR